MWNQIDSKPPYIESNLKANRANNRVIVISSLL